MGGWRVGVVGAGYVAAYHLRALQSIPGVTLAGVADPDQDRARETAAQFGVANVYRSLTEMLAAQKPEAVHILTPPATHCPLAIEALESGCHVFVEKPMAESAADCDRMIEAAQRAGRQLSVNHSARMDPVILEARRRAESGALGNVLAVNFLRNSEYTPYAGGPVVPPPFRKGSYPFQDLGVHALYLIEAFLGEIRNVQTIYFSTGKDPYLLFDEWRAQVECERGVGQISLSWNTQPMLNELVIQGSKGTLFADCYLQTLTARRTLPGVPKPIQRILGAAFNSLSTLKDVTLNTFRFATGKLKPNPGIGMAVTGFYEALRAGQAPPIPASEGRRIVALMEEISARADEAKRRHDDELKSLPVAPARVLVTGAGGFLGSALAERLAASGEPVRVMLRRPSKALAKFPNLHSVYGDLGDAEAVERAVAGVELVYHVGAAMKGWAEEFQRGTVWGTRNVVDACLKHGVRRMVHVSSLSVLDQAGHKRGVPVTESSPYEPFPKKRGAYTQTKLDAEKLVLEAMKEKGLPAVVLRPGQIFGPGTEKFPPSGGLAMAGRWLVIGNGDAPVPLVYVDDVVDALLAAGERPEALGAMATLVDPEVVSQREYADAAKRSLGVKVTYVPKWLFRSLAWGVEMLGKALKRDVPLSRYRVDSLRPLYPFDLRSASEKLGWAPRVGARNGLERVYPQRAPGN